MPQDNFSHSDVFSKKWDYSHYHLPLCVRAVEIIPGLCSGVRGRGGGIANVAYTTTHPNNETG